MWSTTYMPSARGFAPPPSAVTPFFGEVGTRTYVPTALGDNKQYMLNSGHDVYAPVGGIATLYLAEANFWVNPGSSPTYIDSTTGGTLTASAGAEYPAGSGTFYQATWGGGATSTTLADFSIGWAKISIPLPAGKSRINLRRRLQHSANIGLNRQANGAQRYLAGGDACEQTATDKTLSGTVNDSGGDFFTWPAAIVALTTGISIGGIGDSRTIGQGDTTPTDEHMGQLFHVLGLLYPYMNHGVAGQPFVTSSASPLRRALLAYCTTIISVNGYNSRTLSAAAMFAAQQQELTDMAPREGWPGTIYPGSSGSTDGWTTTSGQTVDGFNANRAGFNDLTRALSKYVDPNNYLEFSLDSGLWVPHTPGYTLDGVHATSAGVLLPQYPTFAPSVLNFASFMPSAAPV